MNGGFYGKTARNNIRKNYRFFIPRILSETGLVGCFYIAITLALDGRIADMEGGDYISILMWLGTSVLALLSTVLMLYTNSFLMKQRKSEFGLYNVLGLEKKHVGKILLHESVFTSFISIVCGLGLGMLFYKLCSLFICRLIGADIILGLYFITPKSIIPAAGFFAVLDLVTYIINRINIKKMNPVELLRSGHTGEKEPKIKWPMLVTGTLSLAAGYIISIATKSPLQAIFLFFVAVFLVVIGTYFLFVTGSTFVLKALKKNEKYYYNKKHMPSVSGLLYRMKQNSVGLASITILATGVLIMISTTVSLYSGLQEILDKNYPQHLYLEAIYKTKDGGKENIPSEKLEEFVKSAACDNGAEIEAVDYDEFLLVSYLREGNTFLGRNETDNKNSSNITNLVFITEEDYTRLTGEKANLKSNEIVTCRISSPAGSVHELEGTITLHGKNYTVKNTILTFPISPQVLISSYATFGIVVSDRDVLDTIFEGQKKAFGKYSSDYTRRIGVTFRDIEDVCKNGDEITRAIRASFTEYINSMPEAKEPDYYNIDSYWDAKTALSGMYGAFLFLGILLGTVCLFTTVLIIYYKQISEGYEDRNRFQIMEKIGMSRKEVRKTINSQVLLVFFLPLVVAGIHLIAAFPMLLRLLNILMLSNTTLFIICTVITFAMFAVIYALIYAGTSKTYYKIVH